MNMRIIFLFSISLCFSLFSLACSDKESTSSIDEENSDDISIKSGSSGITFIKTDKGSYYPELKMEDVNTSYLQNNPVKCEIITRSGSYWIGAEYQSVTSGNDKIFCEAVVTSKSGSKLLVVDVYKSLANNLFEVSRAVTVQEVNPEDIGFSTRYTFMSQDKQPISDYDLFVPGIWYKDNAYVRKGALASDYSDNDFWFREDRLPLPFIMLRDKSSGTTFSIIHKEPEGDTYKEETGTDRIIDERLKFASIGLTNNQHPEVGITYPGTEGERTYLEKDGKGWAYRNHPMKKNFQHSYKVAFQLNREEDYTSAIKHTWNSYYEMFAPQLYACDIDKIYYQQIEVLNKYWKTINGAAGVPFRILLNGQMESELDYNFNMGFVGHQPGNASLLIREGLVTKNNDLLSKGEQMADFWANNSVSANGCPKTWYDPYPQTWRGPEVALREIGDGMIGLLRAWNYERMYDRDKPAWLAACTKVADWIVAGQLSDGSFYSHFDYNTGEHTKTHTNCTSHIIPYLAEMYLATGKDNYKRAAIKAGGFIYGDIMNNFRYVGGAIDNPNVMDKEAASMALRAFLALYDIEDNQQWIAAVMQTVYFYRSWVVCWDIPIPKDDDKAVFPANRSVIGQSVIATGHSAVDTYAAIDALGFYRAYLYSGDKQLLHFSKLLQYNTKQFMNWDISNPISWIGEGLFGEAMNISVPRGHGVNYYLPWATYNQLEPLVFLDDIFGYMQIDDIETLPKAEKDKMHKNYSGHRLYNIKKEN